MRAVVPLGVLGASNAYPACNLGNLLCSPFKNRNVFKGEGPEIQSYREKSHWFTPQMSAMGQDWARPLSQEHNLGSPAWVVGTQLLESSSVH